MYITSSFVFLLISPLLSLLSLPFSLLSISPSLSLLSLTNSGYASLQCSKGGIHRSRNTRRSPDIRPSRSAAVRHVRRRNHYYGTRQAVSLRVAHDQTTSHREQIEGRIEGQFERRGLFFSRVHRDRDRGGRLRKLDRVQ